MKRLYYIYICLQLIAIYLSYSLGEDTTTTETSGDSTTEAASTTLKDESTNATVDSTDTKNSTDSANVTSTDDATNSTASANATVIDDDSTEGANATSAEVTANSTATDDATNSTNSANTTGICKHEGHDSSVPAQTSDPGIFMSFEIVSEKELVLHIHAKEAFKGIMISTDDDGEFSIPEVMNSTLEKYENCTGVHNSDLTDKDHIMVGFEKADESSEDPVFNILLVREKDKYWSDIMFPESDKVEHKHSHDSNCVHPGHNASVPAQTSDSGIEVTSEEGDNSTITLHIHADDNPFKGIMIYTDAKGNFTIPEDMPIKLMDGECTGVSNSDDTSKDHVQVDFQMAEDESEKPEFKLLVVRDDDKYWNDIKYQP